MRYFSVYYELKANKIKMDHFNGNLFVENTPEAQAIIKKYYTYKPPIISVDNGQEWVELVNQYTPYFLPEITSTKAKSLFS